MNMRERIMAVIKGGPLDRVPLVQYDGLVAPNEEVWEVLGRDRLGILRWSRVHRERHPNCSFEVKEREGKKEEEVTTLHTPRGSLTRRSSFDPTYGSRWIKKHYVEDLEDYGILNSYLRDCSIYRDLGQFEKDEEELGEDGYPLVALERTPYQQLRIEWVGLENLTRHLRKKPEVVEETLSLLGQRMEDIFKVVLDSPVEFVDFPDNITAPLLGPERFKRYCLPYYNELAQKLKEEGQEKAVFVHMDGDLKPLWELIADSGVDGIDSLSPPPDNDTPLDKAVQMWPNKAFFVNFPSSVHLEEPEKIRCRTRELLEAAGNTGRLQIQFSENVPPTVWRKSLPVIAGEIEKFGPPRSKW